MAIATKTFLSPSPPTPYKVTITLSDKEAEVLMSVLAHVAGDPNKSARKHVAAVRKALVAAGVGEYDLWNMSRDRREMFTEGRIEYKDDPSII